MDRAEYQRQWRKANHAHVLSYWRKYRRAHPERRRNDKLIHRYGITEDILKVLLSLQEGKCGICGSTLLEPCVDHDHKHDFVRGLLCHRCNLGLGYFSDSPLMLMRAAVYLRERDLGQNTKTVVSTSGPRTARQA